MRLRGTGLALAVQVEAQDRKPAGTAVPLHYPTTLSDARVQLNAAGLRVGQVLVALRRAAGFHQRLGVEVRDVFDVEQLDAVVGLRSVGVAGGGRRAVRRQHTLFAAALPPCLRSAAATRCRESRWLLVSAAGARS